MYFDTRRIKSIANTGYLGEVFNAKDYAYRYWIHFVYEIYTSNQTQDMTIQLNTDKNINGTETFTASYIAQIESELGRFSDHITRIEVHLSDEDGQKDGPNTKRCLLEARLEHRQPIAVSSQADTLDQAISGALDKLTASLNSIMGKLSNHPS